MNISIVLFLVIFINILLSLFVFCQSPKSLNNRLFSLLSLMAAVWTYTNYMTEVSDSIFWLHSTYALGAIVMSVGLIWILIMTNKKNNLKRVSFIGFVGLFLFIASFQNGFITNSNSKIYQGAIFTGNPGWGLSLFSLF